MGRAGKRRKKGNSTRWSQFGVSVWCGGSWEGSAQPAWRVAQKDEESPSVSVVHKAAEQQRARLL